MLTYSHYPHYSQNDAQGTEVFDRRFLAVRLVPTPQPDMRTHSHYSHYSQNESGPTPYMEQFMTTSQQTASKPLAAYRLGLLSRTFTLHRDLFRERPEFEYGTAEVCVWPLTN